VIAVRPERLAEYKALHAVPWPEMNAALSAANIRNYSIYLREPENLLFGHWDYIGTDYAADMAVLGLQQAGKNPTRQSFVDNLHKVGTYDGAGLTCTKLDISLENYGKYAPTSCAYFEYVKDGKFVISHGLEEAADLLHARADAIAKGDLPPAADEARSRPREVRVRDRLQRRKPVLAELEDRDGLRKILQPVLAEIGDRNALTRLKRSSRRLREQHLAAVARGGYPGTEVDVFADVSLFSQVRRARVQPHPHPDRAVSEFAPGLADRRDRRIGLGENHEERVSLCVHLHATERPKRRPQDAAMFGQRPREPRRTQLVQELRGAFDVREQKGHGPRWQIVPHNCQGTPLGLQEALSVQESCYPSS